LAAPVVPRQQKLLKPGVITPPPSSHLSQTLKCATHLNPARKLS
jgi:hypothetical protein